VNPHDVLRRIVQHEADEVEGCDGRQAFRQVPKQSRQVAMRSYTLRHLEQRILPVRRFDLGVR
jgi:hypothetical protein